MPYSTELINNSDSIIDLLTAQCGDLEKLLALAREETRAVQDEKFEDVFDIVSERTSITNRLETFQHQISELREHIAAPLSSALTTRIVEVANLTLIQDRQTKLLLTGARDKATAALSNLDKSQRGRNAYLREETRGLAYDQSF